MLLKELVSAGDLEGFSVINANVVISASSSKLVSFLVKIQAVDLISWLYKSPQFPLIIVFLNANKLISSTSVYNSTARHRYTVTTFC